MKSFLLYGPLSEKHTYTSVAPCNMVGVKVTGGIVAMVFESSVMGMVRKSLVHVGVRLNPTVGVFPHPVYIRMCIATINNGYGHYGIHKITQE